MRKVLAFILIVVSVLTMAACGGTNSADIQVPEAPKENGKTGGEEKSTLEKVREQGHITVGFANEKPYAYATPDGKITGQSVEVARAVFKKMGINEINGVVTEFGQLIPGLQAGRFDVITAGMYITPERCQEVLFGEPEYSIGEALAVKKGNPKNLHSYRDIAENPGVKIAVMGGAIEHDWLIKSGVSEEQIEIVPDIPSAIAALQAGRVNATTMTGPTLVSALQSAKDAGIERVADFKQPVIDGESVRGYGAAAFRKEDEDLVEAYNKALKELKESGELLEIIKPFGFTEDELPGDMTTEELCQK
ncbi:ectoine/hydroxyectoine ABC transporter substrate-binding protein EhuB [Bacillaceae bacterium]